LGITGGVGCGKSTVLELLERKYDACVIQADHVAHELMEPGQECYRKIVETFGEEILKEKSEEERKEGLEGKAEEELKEELEGKPEEELKEGLKGKPEEKDIPPMKSSDIKKVAKSRFIDRKKLGAVVFHDAQKREILNSLTHPAVKQEIRRRIAASEKPFIAVEAALLLEDHYDEICDEIWCIYADRDVRLERLAASRGYSRERSLSIMDSQMDDAELRRRCQAAVDNSGTPEETERELGKLLQSRGIKAT